MYRKKYNNNYIVDLCTIYSVAINLIKMSIFDIVKPSMVYSPHLANNSLLKVLESYFTIFLMENSILYAKIAVSECFIFQNLSFKFYIDLLFS